MAYGNKNFGDRPDRGERTMYEGDWKCSECGTSITKLPFQPSPDRLDALKCMDCHKKSAPMRRDRGPRQMYKGDWQCSECGAKITELPFEPRGTDGLKCVDCFKKR